MNDQERLDDLIIDGWQLYCYRCLLFLDAIALIHFCRFNGRHTLCVDFGTGIGVMPLH